MFNESGETFKHRLCFCGYISDPPSPEDVDELPVAVAVIHHKKAVAMDDICLSIYGCSETVEGVDTDLLGMEREKELLASLSVCPSCSSPSELSHKTKCHPLSVQVAVAGSMSVNVLHGSCMP